MAKSVLETVKHAFLVHRRVCIFAIALAFLAFCATPSLRLIISSVRSRHVTSRLVKAAESERVVFHRLNTLIKEIKSGRYSLERMNDTMSRDVVRASHRSVQELCEYSEKELWDILSLPHYCGLQQQRYFYAGAWMNWTVLHREFTASKERAGVPSCILACTYDSAFLCSIGIPCVHSFHLHPNSSDVMQLREFYEWNKISFLKPKFQLGTILDGGAGSGISSVLLATIYPDSAIVSMEPDKDKFNLLRRNLRSFRNVIPLNAAPWPTSASLSLIRLPSTSSRDYTLVDANQISSSQTPSLPTQGISLQFLLRIFGWKAFHLVKLEAEAIENGILTKGKNGGGWEEDVKLALLQMPPGEARSFALSNFFSTNSLFKFVPGISREYHVYQRTDEKIE